MGKTYAIVGWDYRIERMMNDRGWLEAPQGLAQVLIFTGGADVDPAFYYHAKHPTTYFDRHRDDEEQDVFDNASNQLIVGICRGSQFLCVMNGGTLYQDVDNHAIGGTHKLSYHREDGSFEEHQVTSTHHQMQNPFCNGLREGEDFEVWGSANETTYREWMGAGELPKHDDVEILYWPRTYCLGFQPHPEYSSKECRELFFTCLERALGRTL